MLQIKPDSAQDFHFFRLSGVLDEHCDLKALFFGIPDITDVVCGEVNRVNSIGIKAWIEYFTELKKRDGLYTLHEVSAPLVEQLNRLKSFANGIKVLSVRAPYLCSGCRTPFNVVIRTEDVDPASPSVPDVACPKCQKPGSLDDFPEDYFSFLKRPTTSDSPDE